MHNKRISLHLHPNYTNRACSSPASLTPFCTAHSPPVQGFRFCHLFHRFLFVFWRQTSAACSKPSLDLYRTTNSHAFDLLSIFNCSSRPSVRCPSSPRHFLLTFVAPFQFNLKRDQHSPKPRLSVVTLINTRFPTSSARAKDSPVLSTCLPFPLPTVRKRIRTADHESDD
jgi:hypothetical protein